MTGVRWMGISTGFLVLLAVTSAQAIPPADKLNWGADYYATTCQPALQTRSYAELWPMMTRQERDAVYTAQQESYVREQDLYRSWAGAFEKVLRNPERVRSRGQIYPGQVYENFGIDVAAKGAADTLAACVEHMATQLKLHREASAR